MKILVACEESQAVTIEFRKLGHEAYSCDIEPCSGGHPEWHLQQDVIPLLEQDWDMIIAFPPCTHLCVSGQRWFASGHKDRKLQVQGLNFVKKIINSKCKRIAIENPIGIISSRIRKPDQIIRPYMFGENSTKATCLWLKNIPLLLPTKTITPEIHITKKSGKKWDKWFFETSCIGDRKLRSRTRSKTFPGIAKAMAQQWGGQ